MRRHSTHIMRGQTIWDIAIQEHGSVEGVFAVLRDNADQLGSLNDDLYPGQVLRVRSDAVDRDMHQYYKDNDLHPVSGENMLLGGAFDTEQWSNDFDNQEATV